MTMPASVAIRIAAASQTIGTRCGFTRSGDFIATPLRVLRIHPRRDQARFILAEPRAPRRHDAVASVAHARGDACEVAAIEPGAVRQVRCADRRVAASVDAVTGDADLLVVRLTCLLPVF